jgi:hypothetical protein
MIFSPRAQSFVIEDERLPDDIDIDAACPPEQPATPFQPTAPDRSPSPSSRGDGDDSTELSPSSPPRSVAHGLTSAPRFRRPMVRAPSTRALAFAALATSAALVVWIAGLTFRSAPSPPRTEPARPLAHPLVVGRSRRPSARRDCRAATSASDVARSVRPAGQRPAHSAPSASTSAPVAAPPARTITPGVASAGAAARGGEFVLGAGR